MLGAFVVGYLARSFFLLLSTESIKTVSMTRLMFQPYGRIFIQQFTVISEACSCPLDLTKDLSSSLHSPKYGSMYIQF